MNRLFSILVVSLILFSAPSCSTTPSKTPAGIEGNNVVHALKDMSGMYGKKNYPEFINLVSDKYPERQAFAAAIESIFARYQTVQFTVQFTNMLITVEERGMTKAAFNWDSNWQSPGGDLVRNSGRATFVFESKSAKLASIEGKNPFIPQQLEQAK